MKISLMSDLHLEFGDLELPGGDILILSGDVCESRTLRKFKYDPKNILGNSPSGKRLDRAARFFNEEVTKYRRCIYIMGNHEHYHGKFHKTWHELIAEMPDNVEVLEQQHLEIDGVLFLGATLWTDCNRSDPMTHMILKNGMNDYRAITFYDRAKDVYRNLDPHDTIEVHVKTKQYLRTMCELNRDKKIVICTHHAPSFQSINEKYIQEREMNGGYASELSGFILDNENIMVWTHGHMHDPTDYMIGQCRVVSNPRGYCGYEQQADDFDVGFSFEV